MNRAQIIEALQRHAKGEGPAVEWIGGGEVHECRYDANEGPQWRNQLFSEGKWRLDNLDSISGYRLVEPKPEPRTFLGKWIECTAVEAEYAGESNATPDTRLLMVCNGKQVSYAHANHGVTGWFFVKRIEAPPARTVWNVLSDELEAIQNKPVDERTHYGERPTRDELKATQPGRNVIVKGLAEQAPPPSGFVFCDEPWAFDATNRALAWRPATGDFYFMRAGDTEAGYRWIRPAGVPVSEIRLALTRIDGWNELEAGQWIPGALNDLCHKYEGKP